MKKITLILLTAHLLINSIYAEPLNDYITIKINDSDNLATFNEAKQMLYISKSFPYSPIINACGVEFRHKAEGLWFDHYSPHGLKKGQKVELSNCAIFKDEYIKPQDDFQKIVGEEYNKLSAKSKNNYRFSKYTNDYVNKILDSRKWAIIKKGNYGRVLKSEEGNILGIYVADDKYGRKVFAKPDNDIDKLDKLKKQDAVLIKYYEDRDKYNKMLEEKEAKEAEKNKKNEEQEQPEETTDANSTDK